ncbi:hypothetical protein [Paenibacillus agricola]|uniref:Phage protein n=1 Tax=Paenibacillus agricola TaxID=2716264 RepID=A0ABX0J711_9BACL|nr:hypothetical protein [Paenibacillus agricola]NHN31156.1 hypothetical protein [Paenibacillus agricola]
MGESINNFIADHISDNDGEDVIAAVCEAVRNTFGVKCDYAYAGGFDSPGYAVSCYAIAFIELNGEIDIYTHEYVIC